MGFGRLLFFGSPSQNKFPTKKKTPKRISIYVCRYGKYPAKKLQKPRQQTSVTRRKKRVGGYTLASLAFFWGKNRSLRFIFGEISWLLSPVKAQGKCPLGVRTHETAPLYRLFTGAFGVSDRDAFPGLHANILWVGPEKKKRQQNVSIPPAVCDSLRHLGG